MKKLFSIILILFSVIVQAQNLKTTVDNSLLNQGTRGITALKLRNTLNTIVDSLRLTQTNLNSKLSSSIAVSTYAKINTPTIGYFENVNPINPGFYSEYDYVYSTGNDIFGKQLYKYRAGSGFLGAGLDGINQNIIPESSTIDKLLQTQINSKLEISAAANYANLSSNNVFTGSNRFLNPIFVNSTSSSQYSSITGVWSNTERNGIFSFRYNTPFGSNTVTWDPIRMNVNGQVGIGMNPTESFEVLGGAKFNSGISATNLAASGSVAANSLTSSTLRVTGLSVFADNTAAKAGGLTAGAHYRTDTGVVMVVF